MGDKERQIVCYTDDVSLIAETAHDFQRLTLIFNTTSKKFNMIISAKKKKKQMYVHIKISILGYKIEID